MEVYSLLVLIHVISAVVGMGPSFALPIIASFGNSKDSLRFINKIMEKTEKMVTIGSIALLITGLIMGFLNTYLFTQVWYIGSIVLYFIAHYLAVGFSGKKTKKAVALINEHQGEDIPSEVMSLNKSVGMAGMASSLIAILMIVLMSIKPF